MGGSVIAMVAASVVLTGVAFAHAVGPAIFLLALTPFDAIPFMMFGVIGNAITFVPILILLVRTNPGLWGQVFFGTRIQRIAFVFVLTLLVAHAAGIGTHGLGEILNWLRFVTLFILMGVFAWLLQQANHILLLVRVMVLAMVLLTLLSMIDFYVGIQLLPLKVGELSGAALDIKQESYEAWRFTGSGFPVNRYANYLLPVTFLSVGWFMRVKSTLDRGIAIACTGILVFAELLTVSRSGLLGMAVAAVVLLPMALGIGVRQVVGLAIVGGAFGMMITLGLEYTSGGDALSKRFGTETLGGGVSGRVLRWVTAWKIWAGDPFLGVGWGHFHQHSAKYIKQGGLGAHNSYFHILAETGLLGFLPMMFLLYTVITRFLKRVGDLSPGIEFWRPYFFCGLVAQLVSIFFNDYFFERYLWFCFAFGIVLERLSAVERRRVMLEKQEVVRNFSSRPLHST